MSYFKILNLPITGSSFALPFTAFIMPMTSITRNTRFTRPRRVPKREPSVQLMLYRMVLTTPVTIHHAISVIASTKPWLAWNLANLDCGAAKMGISTSQERYAKIPMTLFCSISALSKSAVVSAVLFRAAIFAEKSF